MHIKIHTMKERRKERERGERIYILKVKLSQSKCGYTPEGAWEGRGDYCFFTKLCLSKAYFMSNFKAFWSNLSMFSFSLLVDLETNPPLQAILPKAMNDCYYCVLSVFFNCLTHLNSLYRVKLIIFERKCEVMVITQYCINFSPQGLPWG